MVMISLNKFNGADKRIMDYAQELMNTSKTPLIGCIFGVAYGGEVEELAKLWKGKGIVYGYDTFEGHPKFMSKDPHAYSLDRECMEVFYKKFGTEKLSYEYQRNILDEQGLDNAVLVKGLIDEHSCDHLPYIDLALLDLDILESTEIAYKCIKDRYTDGNKLFLHDVYPPTHMPRISKWYLETILGTDGWKEERVSVEEYMAVVKRDVRGDLRKRLEEIVKGEEIVFLEGGYVCTTCGKKSSEMEDANKHATEHIFDNIVDLLLDRRKAFKKYEAINTA